MNRQHTVRSCGSRREGVPGWERSRETPCKGPEAGEGMTLRLSILKAAWFHPGGWGTPPPLLSAGAPLTTPRCGSAWLACLALPLASASGPGTFSSAGWAPPGSLLPGSLPRAGANTHVATAQQHGRQENVWALGRSWPCSEGPGIPGVEARATEELIPSQARWEPAHRLEAS